MAGALGALQASSLARHCIDLEYQLHNTRLDIALTEKVQLILKRLATILSTLA
ncbi:hypothetical protein D3C77_813310 [compost metagenome]